MSDCRAGLAWVYVTAELKRGVLEIGAVRIYREEPNTEGDESELGFKRQAWVEQHLGCEHDR